MNSNSTTRGSLPQIITNAESLYEGNLRHYFSVLFHTAQNVNHPYHNWRHMMHVTTMAYFACQHHNNELRRLQIREILIAAMFHDADHSGLLGQDDLNIERAVRVFKAHMLPEDQPHQNNIVSLMQDTEFPYKVSSDGLLLNARILRDADMAQVFSLAWMQQVIFGFASEWRKAPLDVLRLQIPFLDNITFSTEWGQTTYPKKVVEEKIEEVKQLLELLDLKVPSK